MADRIALDVDALSAALRVLRREQSAYLPTRRQIFLYHAFNVSAFSIVVAGALLLVSYGMGLDAFRATVDAEIISELTMIGLVIAAISAAGMLVLFPLNFGLMRKLYQHAKMRKRLKLANYFAPAFSADRKMKKLTNFLTMVMFAFGLLIFASGIMLVVLAIIDLLTTDFFSNEPLVFLIILACALALMITGVSFSSIHFVRRGRRRLDVVRKLEQSLEKQSVGGVSDDPGVSATLSASEYNAIAGIERQQIIRDRATSIAAGRKETTVGYTCQTSRQMYQTKSGLSPEMLVKVEGSIADLLKDPTAVGHAEGVASGEHVLRVAGTPLSIHYAVDSQRHLVQLFELENAQV